MSYRLWCKTTNNRATHPVFYLKTGLDPESFWLVNRTATKIPFIYFFLIIAWPQSQFPHSYVCELFIYSQDRSTYFLQQNRQIDHKSLRHMNVELGLWLRNCFSGNICFDFQCWFFADPGPEMHKLAKKKWRISCFSRSLWRTGGFSCCMKFRHGAQSGSRRRLQSNR